jgi:WD40 repeat protein
MSDVNHFEDCPAYESLLQELAWTIAMSEGQFSLILVRCNYPVFQEQMVQKLRELCRVEIRKIVIDNSVKKLYSDIREQLGDEQPPALIVFGLEFVSDIDQVLISMNQVREEFRKNFHFPLVLWVNDQVLKKLIRLVPDFESWTITIELPATNELSNSSQSSKDKSGQSQSSEDLDTLNYRSLLAFSRGMEMAQGNFSLFLVHCNYTILRYRIVQQLRKMCPVNFRELNIDESVERLYRCIQDQLGQEQPAALMVFGLENVTALDHVLAAIDRFPEEFSKNFHFPLVLWVTDEVLKKLIRLAPEFHSCSTSTKLFLGTDDLLNFVQSNVNRVFSTILDTSNKQLLLNSVILEPYCFRELEQASKDLKSQKQELNSRQKGGLEFVLGLNAYTSKRISDALSHFEQSLHLLSLDKSLTLQGAVILYIGLCYRYLGELNQTERSSFCQMAREYLQKCIDVFEQAQRADLIAKFINQLSEVLQCLEAWDDLQVISEKSLKLHQTYGYQVELAQDYGFLAQVALKHCNGYSASKLCHQALDVLANVPKEQQQNQSLYLFLLGKSLWQLGQKQQAIDSLEKAKQEINLKNNLKNNLSLYINILEELRLLYLDQSQYIASFRIKREIRLIRRQYELTAFVGAATLQPKSSTLSQQAFENQQTIAQEIATSGRKLDVNRLIERVARFDYKLIVIHGQSGVGKSSILQAGLIPALQQVSIDSRNALPILLRVYTDWVGMLGRSLIESVKSLQGVSLNSTEDILDQLRKNEERNLLTVLIFDQLEEFFFVYTDQGSRRQFYSFLKDCLDIPFVKVILSLREDYLHYLLEFERTEYLYGSCHNDVLDQRTRYYLGNFSPEEAKAVVQSLINNSQFNLEPDLVDQLVADLSGEFGEVRPVELQLVGAQLEAEKITTLDQYLKRGSKEELVKRFLEEVVEDCGSEYEYVTWLILYFLTNKNGTRPLKTRSELSAISELENEKLEFLLEVLVQSGLVLLIPEAPEERYQLVHDYLVAFIRQKQESAGLLDVEVELKLTKGQLRQALREQEIAKIKVLNSSSKALLLSYNQLEALVNAFEAGRQLRKTKVPLYVKIDTICTLRQAVYSVRECNRLEGHSAGVNNINFSSDGQMLASASDDGTVILWRSDGTQFKTFRGHTSRVTTISFTPDRSSLISTDGDGILKLWYPDGTELQSLKGHDNRITSIKFSPDGQILASASDDGTLKLWRIDISGLHLFRTYYDLVYDISFSLDSQTLVCAGDDGTLKLWRIDSSEKQLFLGHKTRVTSVCFNSNGQILVSASLDGTIKLWHFNGTQLIEQQVFQAHRDWITTVKFSVDGQTLASASEDGAVKLWSLEGTELQTLRGHNDKITSISFNPDGQTLASSGGEGIIKLWRLKGREPKIFRGHNDKVTSIRFSTDGQTLVSASEDGTVKLWRLDGTELKTNQRHNSKVTSLSFNSNNQTLVFGDEDGYVEFWSLYDEESMFPLVHNYGITSVCFSPDGQILVFAGEDGTIEFWNKDALQASCKYKEIVTSISFSPNGQIFASASGDGLVKLWHFNGNQLQELRSLQAHSKRVTSICFSPNGQTLASASEDCTVKLWNLDGIELAIFRGHNKKVTSVCFSPDGQTLASASEDCTVKLWSWDGTTLQIFKAHSDWVMDVAFSSDGQTLASASRDRTVILWDLNLDALLEYASNWLTDYMKTNSSRN